MKLIDLVFLMLLACGGYRGFKKGLVVELFSVGALVLAQLGSTKLLGRALSICTKWYQGSSVLLPYILFVLLFVNILIATTLVGKLLRTLLKPTLLGSLDRFLGSIVGVLKWAVCSSACLWLGRWAHLNMPETYTAHSLLFPIIEPLAPMLLSLCTSWLPYPHEGSWILDNHHQ